MDSFLAALRDISFLSNVAFKSLKISESVTIRIAKEFALIADCVERKNYDLFLAERNPAVKCAATTAKGELCKKTAAKDETFCKMHLKAKAGCTGLTTKGTKCKRASVEGSEFCKTHGEAEAVQYCSAQTSKGASCKRKAISDTEFCKAHTLVDEQKEHVSVQYCSAQTSKGASCKKRAVLDTEYCKVHGKKQTSVSEEVIKILCKGLTAKGQKCKRVPLTGLEFCAAHRNEEVQEVADLLKEEFENFDQKQVEALEDQEQVQEQVEDRIEVPEDQVQVEVLEDRIEVPEDQVQVEVLEDQDQEISNLLEEAFEEINDPEEPFDTYEVDPTGEELKVGTELGDDIEVFRSTANYICLVLKDKVKTKYAEPIILRTEDGYQLVAETTKKGNPLFTLRLEDSVEFEVKSIKTAFSFLRKTLELSPLEGKLTVIKERRISE